MNALLETITGWLHYSALTGVMMDAWLKSVAVLAIAAGACWCCRRAAAATRHWIWFLAMASLPCLLLLSAVPRAWHRPLWPLVTNIEPGNQVSIELTLGPAGQRTSSAAPALPAGKRTAPADPGSSHTGQAIAARFHVVWLAIAFSMWAIGAVASLVYVLAGQVRLVGLARNAYSLQSGEWARLLQEACDKLELRRPVRLLQSKEDPMPLTWGWWRPKVLLPAEAEHWPIERRRVVLLHELAHVKRWDCLTQTIARIVCIVFWLNPLAWVAAQRMCVEREKACDDLVLNSGCRATDYASHLVEIARTFRRAPQFAGIAMARSPQLQGRIAAIIDASRARRLRPLTALASLVLMGALALCFGGGRPDALPDSAEDSALRQQQMARLQEFSRAKEKQSQELSAKAGEQISPQFQAFFTAATRGDWPTVTNRYAYYKQHHGQYSNGTNAIVENLRTAYWQPVLEICLAYDHVVNCEPKYTTVLADGIINSIPAGSIYFGGTDPGRGVPTAFSKSHADADPFFTLTQNALADGTYLEYLRRMYGGKIYTPTGEDSQRCFQEYLADAQGRLQEHKLKPGEDVKMVDGKVIVSGQVAVISIYSLLAKVIFDHNPDREFYVEESFPVEWMYPYLEPHGLIMKLNRQPLAQLSAETLVQDREYWRKLVGGMLGDWLDEQTTVAEVAAFVDRVYAHRNLQGFAGDPRFVQNAEAQKLFSKLRSSIGGLYAWRLGAMAASEYRPKTSAEYEGLVKEADLAFRQAFVLCPYSPEALFRYVQFLLQLARFDDAILVTQTFLKLDPQNGQGQALLESLKSYKAQQSRVPAISVVPMSRVRVTTNGAFTAAAVPAGSILTAEQVEDVAVVLANREAQRLYHRQPFQVGRPAVLADGYWTWRDGRAHGGADLEATVKFKADGSQPEVKVLLLDSRPAVRF